MFIDRAHIKTTGGAGGNGCCSFRREKYVPLGGPNGGDGGHGGDVYIVATARLTSLLDLSYHSTWQGKRGVHGRGSNCHGKKGEQVLIEVPCGTVLRDFESHEILCDLTAEGDRFLAAHGGRGGKGNARFLSPTNRAPRFAEQGEPGEEREYLLELKLIADVGIVGLPNAGKSTLLATVSAAKPKIADYPFTTLAPNLGVVQLGQFRTLTVADIPGIIEGAANGKGLGHDFLRHIERTRVLLFLIDLGDEDPVKTRNILENELTQHSLDFGGRPRLYALNKADIPENRAHFEKLQAAFHPVHLLSAATGEGVPALLEELWMLVDRARQAIADETPVEPEREYTYEAPYQIEPTPDGFHVEGKGILRAVRMTDFENPEAVRHLQDILRRSGLLRALKRLGAQQGQTITIGDLELEYHPDQ